jgi:hypothetical protein
LVPVKIPYEGETVDADDVDFKILSCTPIVVLLADGTKIEIEHTIGKVYLVRDKKREDGSPIYMMTGGSKVTTKYPEKEPS